MKASSATSAKAATVETRRTGRSSGRPQPTPISAEQFALSGPSRHPDQSFNAYRKDLADIALAGEVIASHYAEPVERKLVEAAALHVSADDAADPICQLEAGEPFALLDDTQGWAWGYAGRERRVGYVRSEAVSSA